MEIELTKAEAAFIKKVVREHYEYYQLLSLSSKCTEGNRTRWELVRCLVTKLEDAQSP